MRALVPIVLLVGCQAAALPVRPPPPPCPVVEATAPQQPAQVISLPVAEVVRAYQAARTREIPAVSVPGVTAEYVAGVHNLEVAAREAVRRLVVKRTPDALAKARAAVSDLAAALNAPP